MRPAGGSLSNLLDKLCLSSGEGAAPLSKPARRRDGWASILPPQRPPTGLARGQDRPPLGGSVPGLDRGVSKGAAPLRPLDVTKLRPSGLDHSGARVWHKPISAPSLASRGSACLLPCPAVAPCPDRHPRHPTALCVESGRRGRLCGSRPHPLENGPRSAPEAPRSAERAKAPTEAQYAPRGSLRPSFALSARTACQEGRNIGATTLPFSANPTPTTGAGFGRFCGAFFLLKYLNPISCMRALTRTRAHNAPAREKLAS